MYRFLRNYSIKVIKNKKQDKKKVAKVAKVTKEVKNFVYLDNPEFNKEQIDSWYNHNFIKKKKAN